MCSTKWLPSEGWGIQENIRKGNIMPKQIKGQNVWNAWGPGHVFHTFQEVANTSKLATSDKCTTAAGGREGCRGPAEQIAAPSIAAGQEDWAIRTHVSRKGSIK